MAPHKQANTRGKSTHVANASARSKVVSSSWWETSSFNRLAKRVTHYTKSKLIGYKVNSSNTVLPSTSIKQYICDNWVPQRRQKQQRHDAVPSLAQMNQDIIAHIFDFLANDEDNIPVFLALSQTCRTFNNILGNDEMWEKLYPIMSAVEFEQKTTSRERVFISRALRNIRRFQKMPIDLYFGNTYRRVRYTSATILDYMGGADGIRRIITLLLDKTTTNEDEEEESIFRRFLPMLRGDTIFHPTEVVQEYIIDKIGRANIMAMQFSKPGVYPKIELKHLRSVDICRSSIDGWNTKDENMDENFAYCSVSNGHHVCCHVRYSGSIRISIWQDSFCTEQDIIEAENMDKMIRALAYRAGAVQLSGDVFTTLAIEVMHHLNMLVRSAFKACADEYNALNDRDSECGVEEEGKKWFPDNYFANHCPPFELDSDGEIKCVIIPRHIKDAAVRNGLKSLLSCGKFGAEWAPSKDRTKEEEVDEAKAQYYLEDNIAMNNEYSSEDESDDGGRYDDDTSISYCSSDTYDSDEYKSYEEDPSESEESDDDLTKMRNRVTIRNTPLLLDIDIALNINL